MANYINLYTVRRIALGQNANAESFIDPVFRYECNMADVDKVSYTSTLYNNTIQSGETPSADNLMLAVVNPNVTYPNVGTESRGFFTGETDSGSLTYDTYTSSGNGNYRLTNTARVSGTLYNQDWSWFQFYWTAEQSYTINYTELDYTDESSTGVRLTVAAPAGSEFKTYTNGTQTYSLRSDGSIANIFIENQNYRYSHLLYFDAPWNNPDGAYGSQAEFASSLYFQKDIDLTREAFVGDNVALWDFGYGYETYAVNYGNINTHNRVQVQRHQYGPFKLMQEQIPADDEEDNSYKATVSKSQFYLAIDQALPPTIEYNGKKVRIRTTPYNSYIISSKYSAIAIYIDDVFEENIELLSQGHKDYYYDYTLPSKYKGVHRIRARFINSTSFKRFEETYHAHSFNISDQKVFDWTDYIFTYNVNTNISNESYIGILENPTGVKQSRTSDYDVIRVSWNEVDNAEKYYIKTYNESNVLIGTEYTTNKYIDVTCATPDTVKKLRIYAYKENINLGSYASIEVSPNAALALPSNIRYSRTAYNEIKFTFDNVTGIPLTAGAHLAAYISANNTDTLVASYNFSTDTGTSITIGNLPQGANTIVLRNEADGTLFRTASNASYYNSMSYVFNINMSKLNTPVLSYTDYPDPNPNNAYVELSWKKISYATGYVLYEEYRYYDATNNTWVSGTENYTLASNENSKTIKDTSTTQGEHTYYVQAVVSEGNEGDEDYSSESSNTWSYNHSPLTAPVIEYDGETSVVQWEDSDENADRYLVTTYANGVSDSIVTVTKDEELKYNVYYSIVNPNSVSLLYSTYVTAMSNNAFYYYPSTASNVLADYNVIVLGKAEPDFDYNTSIISWNAVEHATGYLLSIRSSNGTTEFTLDANTTSYDISDYPQDLYTAMVQALGSRDNITDRPYYLNSWDIGSKSFGVLNPPVIYRFNNVLSWESVGADYYEVYRDNVRVAVVNDGTTETTNKTVKCILDAVPVGTYEYKVKGYYVGSEGEQFESRFSNIVSVTVSQLSATTCSFENGLSILHWTAVPNATYYKVYSDNHATYHDDLTDLTEIINEDSPKVTPYKVSVIAANDVDPFAYLDSEPSNELDYTVLQLGIPTLTLDTQNRRLTWTSVTYAHHYNLTINNNTQSISANYYDISGLSADTYTAYVTADTSSTLYTNPKYLKSKISNIVSFGTLSAPVISLQPNTTKVVWEAVSNAEFYDIYNDGKYLTSTNLNYYTLLSDSATLFTINVIARSSLENVFDSNLSNTVQLRFVSLNQVQGFRLTDSTNTISWNPVNNARGYRIYSNNRLVVSLFNGETSYNLSTFFQESIGLQELYVIAVGEYVSNNIYYINSIRSNTINKIVYAAQRYNLVINGVNYNSVHLPFTYNTTIDSSLDSASITIGPINRKEPFEAYGEATLWIYDNSLKSPEIEVNMIVAADDVDEIRVGNDIMFNHNISLVERTRLLQSEILPSFSVTQPEKVVNDIAKINKVIEPRIPHGHRIWNKANELTFVEFATRSDIIRMRHEGIINGWLEAAMLAASVVDPVNVIGSGLIANVGLGTSLEALFAGGVTAAQQKIYQYRGNHVSWSSMPQELNVHSSVILPIEFGEPSYNVWYSWYGGNIATIANKEIKTTRRYYIRNHTYNANYDPNYPEKFIGSCYGTEESISYRFDEPGLYDIILEIDDIYSEANKRIPLMGSDEDNDPNILSVFGIPIGKNVVGYTWDGMSFSGLTSYRVVFPAVHVKPIYDDTSTVGKITIKDTLNKIISIIDPLDVNEKPRYTIDPIILAKTEKITCPELSIQNGKTLYEVLEILGREFNGIPRLLKNNVITYDILNETTSFNLHTNGFKDLDVEEASGSSIENHATGFISNVSNLISDNFITTYPAGNLWTTARADDETSLYVQGDSAVIQVDKPIYKFKNLYVRNVFESTPDAWFDLTQYVKEKTVFDALSDSENGKGLALYWKSGSDKIYGLGQLPEASALYAALNWQSDKYVIHNILENATGVTNFAFNDIMDLQFKVTYVPIINTVSYIEQSTITDLGNYNYKAYNQEDNVVSDSRLYKSADEQLKRLGNNSITKLYTVLNMSQIPLLGYSKVIDDDVYYMDDITYKFDNKYIDCSVNLSKNINKINLRVGLDSSYRQYEIYNSNFVDRTLNFNDYCFIDFQRYTNTERLSSSNWPNIISNALYGDGTTTSALEKPNAFYINACRDRLGNKVKWTKYNSGGQEEEATGILLNASATTGLNSIQFSASMFDNYSAGQSASETLPITVGESKKRVMKDVRYVDDYGKCDYMKILLTTINDTNASQLGSNIERRLPECNWIYEAREKAFSDTAIFNKNIVLLKDNREKICYNYQMHFISKNKDIYIHPGLTKYLFKNYKFGGLVGEVEDAQHTPIWIGYSRPILSRDKYTDNYVTLGTLELTNSNGNIIISGFNYTNVNVAGYALIWPDTKEVILDIRRPLSGSGSTSNMYMSLSNIKI